MSGKTVTRADLAESVFRKVGLSRTESAQLVETVIDEICNAIVRGESVKLSSFATFQVRSQERTHRPQSQDRRGSADFAAPGDDLQGLQRAEERILKSHLSRKAKAKA